MFTHVRPTEFLEGFFLIFTSNSVRQPNLIRLPFGEGRTAPVIAENVARMVRHAALHAAVARWQDLSLDRSATREHAPGSSDRTARLWDLSAKDPAANPVVLRGHDRETSVAARGRLENIRREDDAF